MKKKMISATLKFTPRIFQYKVLCKVLNYICIGHSLIKFENKIIKLTVIELDRSWFVKCEKGHFKYCKSHKATLEINIKLDTALNLKSKAVILNALSCGDIKLRGDTSLVAITHHLLTKLDEKRLETISTSLSSFFKLKTTKTVISVNHAQLGIEAVQLSDLHNDLDVNFIRDEAIKCEKTNLKKALHLMLLAQQARPNGPFISNKVSEYKRLLETS